MLNKYGSFNKTNFHKLEMISFPLFVPDKFTLTCNGSFARTCNGSLSLSSYGATPVTCYAFSHLLFGSLFLN